MIVSMRGWCYIDYLSHNQHPTNLISNRAANGARIALQYVWRAIKRGSPQHQAVPERRKSLASNRSRYTDEQIIAAARQALDRQGYIQSFFHPHELIGSIVSGPGGPMFDSRWYLQFKTQQQGRRGIQTVYVRVSVAEFPSGLQGMDFSDPSSTPYPSPVW